MTLMAFGLGLALASACEDSNDYTCKIEYVAMTGGEPVETEKKKFGDFPTPLDAVEACNEYAEGRLNEQRKSFTCTCIGG
jgi:hypothetical protein